MVVVVSSGFVFCYFSKVFSPHLVKLVGLRQKRRKESGLHSPWLGSCRSLPAPSFHLPATGGAWNILEHGPSSSGNSAAASGFAWYSGNGGTSCFCNIKFDGGNEKAWWTLWTWSFFGTSCLLSVVFLLVIYCCFQLFWFLQMFT